MKTMRFVLLGLPLLLLALTRPAAAGPAMVTMFPDGACLFGWAGMDSSANFQVILLPGKGVQVQSNNARGNASLHCDGQIDFGAMTDALDLSFNPVHVRLLTIDEVCSVNPGPCRGGGNGAVNFNFDNTGLTCIVDVVPTTKYSERVTPSGQVQITCHLPE